MDADVNGRDVIRLTGGVRLGRRGELDLEGAPLYQQHRVSGRRPGLRAQPGGHVQISRAVEVSGLPQRVLALAQVG